MSLNITRIRKEEKRLKHLYVKKLDREMHKMAEGFKDIMFEVLDKLESGESTISEIREQLVEVDKGLKGMVNGN